MHPGVFEPLASFSEGFLSGPTCTDIRSRRRGCANLGVLIIDSQSGDAVIRSPLDGGQIGASVEADRNDFEVTVTVVPVRR